MKSYSVTYKLAGMYHSYIVEADNELSAIEKVVSAISPLSRSVFHDFKIERFFEEWN